MSNSASNEHQNTEHQGFLVLCISFMHPSPPSIDYVCFRDFTFCSPSPLPDLPVRAPGCPHQKRARFRGFSFLFPSICGSRSTYASRYPNLICHPNLVCPVAPMQNLMERTAGSKVASMRAERFRFCYHTGELIPDLPGHETAWNIQNYEAVRRLHLVL